MRFFTSDLHFNHTNVIAFCTRPWVNVDDMNRGLIMLWNEAVKPDDEVYILGDMFFCGVTKAKEILVQLNGRKRLVMGNHDWGKLKCHRAVEYGFEWIESHQHCVRIGKWDVILNHFPYTGDHMEQERYVEYRPADKGNWLLHGHVHNAWKIKGRQINVGVDVWNYRPVPEYTILDIINGTYV